MNRFNVETYIKGQQLGTCTFIEYCGEKLDKNTNKHRTLGRVRCNCGKEFITTLSAVKRGAIKTCGCLNKQKVIEANTVHGLCKHPLYGQWQDIKNRCNNPNIKSYYRYGKRGVSVCEEWTNSFLPFYKWAIKNNWEWGLSVDRINNDGNYEPTNCRIATNIQQARNRSNNVIIEYNGEYLCIAELCERLKLNYSTTRNRISKLGWSVEKAISIERKTDKIKRLYAERSSGI